MSASVENSHQEEDSEHRSAREFEYTREHFDFLRRLSNEHSGIVVSDDKFDMFYSRLSRRLRVLGFRSFGQYCEHLKTDSGDEFTQFINAVTTNLTSFFRERHHFDYLRTDLLPGLLRQNADTRRIRIWSSGCSTGEEPYSLAITVKEAIPEALADGWDVRILATDIDSNVLATAQTGVYSEERLNGLNEIVVKRWFKKGAGANEGLARVDPDLSGLISFRQLNLMQAWPMSGPFDVVMCRNVIIYFDQETKLDLVNRYAEILKPDGKLILGHSESLYQLSDRFDLLSNTVYQRAY